MSERPLTLQQALADALGFVQMADQGPTPNYQARNTCVLLALGVAQNAGYEAGIRWDPRDPAWPVAFIELPTGQVSWHLPMHPHAWDGHTTEEKYQRIAAFIAEQVQP